MNSEDKLFVVNRLPKSIVLLAKNEKEALSLAPGYLKEQDKSDGGKEYTCKQFLEKTDLPKDWEGWCIPWGSLDDKVIDDYLLNYDNAVEWLCKNTDSNLSKLIYKLIGNFDKNRFEQKIKELISDNILYFENLELKIRDNNE